MRKIILICVLMMAAITGISAEEKNWYDMNSSIVDDCKVPLGDEAIFYEKRLGQNLFYTLEITYHCSGGLYHVMIVKYLYDNEYRIIEQPRIHVSLKKNPKQLTYVELYNIFKAENKKVEDALKNLDENLWTAVEEYKKGVNYRAED